MSDRTKPEQFIYVSITPESDRRSLFLHLFRRATEWNHVDSDQQYTKLQWDLPVGRSTWDDSHSDILDVAVGPRLQCSGGRDSEVCLLPGQQATEPDRSALRGIEPHYRKRYSVYHSGRRSGKRIRWCRSILGAMCGSSVRFHQRIW